MKKFFLRHWLSIILVIASVTAMFVAWAIAYKAEGNDLVVPSVTSSLKEFFELFTENSFWRALLTTALDALIAVVISFAVASLCAITGAVWRPIRAFWAPIIAVLRVVPTMAVILILILAFPRAQVPVAVTFLVMFPLMYSQISAAIAGVDNELLDMAKVYRLKRSAVVLKIIIPQVAPVIVMQLGSNLSFAIKLSVSAEVIAGVAHSIGGMMQMANYWIEIARLAALTIASVILGLLVELIFFVIDKFTFKWRTTK